jgi:hypothetical protein
VNNIPSGCATGARHTFPPPAQNYSSEYYYYYILCARGRSVRPSVPTRSSTTLQPPPPRVTTCVRRPVQCCRIKDPKKTTSPVQGHYQPNKIYKCIIYFNNYSMAYHVYLKIKIVIDKLFGTSHSVTIF